jgi:2-methylisocitrate lyase-like PEP mutase family enzyme
MSIAERGKCEAFRRLHAAGTLLVLPNAWDAGSARIIEECGATAIATSSAGMAWAHGYPDGNALPRHVVVGAVGEIARVVHVPLTVDVEGGYADDPEAAADVVAAVIDAGAVGINLEDGSGEPDLLCAKIAAVKRVAARAGVDLFVNARTDVFLRRLVPAERAVETTIARAARYRDAGCDGVFVPLIAAPADVRTVAAAVAPLPLNVLAIPGLPAAAELRTLGVRRLSAGAGIAGGALARARRLATDFLRDGQSDVLFAERIDTAATNALFPRA